MNMRILAVATIAGLLALPLVAQDRDTKVRNDKREVMEDGYWIYNDLPAGIEQAKLLGRPLMVVFRCIP